MSVPPEELPSVVGVQSGTTASRCRISSLLGSLADLSAATEFGSAAGAAVILDQHFPRQGLDVEIGAADHDRQFADLQADKEKRTGQTSGTKRASTVAQFLLAHE
jgi:hypothetical protein